jgi:hypothetical protein
MGTPQSFTLTRTQVTGALAGTSTTNVSPTGGTVGITGGGQVTAGVFDDPFFFDLVGFNNTLDPMSSATFTGTDTFAGANVSAIVFEVPIAQLTDGSTQVAVRAVTTDVLGNQVDQMGRPAINTALIPTGSKDAFNASDPADQLAMFGTDVEASLTALGAADPAGLTNVLLPDLLTVDFANPTTYLNGRGLTDDVMDATLNLVTNGAIPGDGVDVNMEGFQSVFPFLQVANVSAVPEPSSVALLLAASGGILVRRRKR